MYYSNWKYNVVVTCDGDVFFGATSKWLPVVYFPWLTVWTQPSTVLTNMVARSKRWCCACACDNPECDAGLECFSADDTAYSPCKNFDYGRLSSKQK